MSELRFRVGPDIANQASIQRGDGSHYKTCITWPGAYIGAFWRNALGRFYTPWNPSERRRRQWKRERSKP